MSSGKSIGVGEGGRELQVGQGDQIRLSVTVAARLENEDSLPVELIVNGYPVQTKTIVADGAAHEVQFEVEVNDSQWIAIRAFPHAHSNPIYAVCDEKPIRGSIDSIRWCLAGVEQCWNSKQHTYADDEQDDAREAYDHARRVYLALLREAEND